MIGEAVLLFFFSPKCNYLLQQMFLTKFPGSFLAYQNQLLSFLAVVDSYVGPTFTFLFYQVFTIAPLVSI